MDIKKEVQEAIKKEELKKIELKTSYLDDLNNVFGL